MSLSSGEPFQDVVRITERRDYTGHGRQLSHGDLAWPGLVSLLSLSTGYIAGSHTWLTFDFHGIREESRDPSEERRGHNTAVTAARWVTGA